jgi:hypothetical protein
MMHKWGWCRGRRCFMIIGSELDRPDRRCWIEMHLWTSLVECAWLGQVRDLEALDFYALHLVSYLGERKSINYSRLNVSYRCGATWLFSAAVASTDSKEASIFGLGYWSSLNAAVMWESFWSRLLTAVKFVLGRKILLVRRLTKQ